MARKNRAEYERQVQMEKERFREYEEARTRAKGEKHFQVCKRITLELVDLSLKVAEYKDLSDGEEPIREYAEWKTLFLSGLPLFDAKQEETVISQEDEILNEEELKRYLEAAEEWKDREPGEEPKNYVLGSIIDELIAATSPPPENPADKIPEFPVKAAIVGKAFSGKSTQARKLATKFHASIISTEDLLQEAVSSLEAPDKELVPEYRSLAEAARRSLKEGKEVDDRVMVGLFVNKIQKVENLPETGGWILDGFPRNLNQAQLLEKQLTGYEPPHKQNRSKSKRHSRLTTPPPKSEAKEPPKASGIDLIVRLDVEDDVVMRRAVGRRIDPETGNIYHLEYNPPPGTTSSPFSDVFSLMLVVAVDQQMINERLVIMDGGSQVQKSLLSYNENKKLLEEWFSIFGTLKATEGNHSVDSIFRSIESQFHSIIEKKALLAQQKREEEEVRKVQQEAEEAARREREQKTREEEAKRQEEERIQKEREKAEKEKQTKKEEDKKPRRRLRVEDSREEGSNSSSEDKKEEEKETEINDGASITSEMTADTSQTASSVTQQLQRSPSVQPEVPENSLSLELANILMDNWKNVESHYVEGAKRSFQVIREERDSVVKYLANTKNHFVMFLNRPDGFQEKVNSFHQSFNDIDSDMRDHVETKQVPILSKFGSLGAEEAAGVASEG